MIIFLFNHRRVQADMQREQHAKDKQQQQAQEMRRAVSSKIARRVTQIIEINQNACEQTLSSQLCRLKKRR
jgi:hypothetical protein